MGRRVLAMALTVGLLAQLPARAQAAPDPVIASLLSAGSTVIPLAVSGGLLLTGRGSSEGLRYDLGKVFLGIGAIPGPSIGQIYGRGGVDALVTFLLRAVTGAVLILGVSYALRGDENQTGTGNALLWLGGVPTGLLAIWDIYAASVSAREARYEEGHAEVWGPNQILVDVARCGPIPCAL